MISKIKPGVLFDETRDPMCCLKGNEELVNKEYDHKEPRTTVPGHWFEDRQFELLNNCHDKDPRVPQCDDDSPRPIPLDQRDGKGGPVWTKK